MTGQAPFRGKNAIEVIRMVLNEEPEMPIDLVPEIPEGINDMVLDLMEKEPQHRPQNPSDLIAEVTRVLEAPQRANRRRAQRAASRSNKSGGNGLLVVIIICFLALIGGAVWFFVFR